MADTFANIKRAKLVIKALSSLTLPPSARESLFWPSALLCYADLRAVALYVDLDDCKDTSEIAKTLAKHGFHLLPSRTAYDPPGTDYIIINDAVFKATPDRYPFVRDIWVAPLRFDLITDLTAWSGILDWKIARKLAETDREAWLSDWFTPGHIRIGMLLGYPWTAIESMANPASKGVQDVIIASGDQKGQDVSYFTNQRDLAHEQLWRTTIDRLKNDAS